MSERRPYEASHPWLTFGLNINRFDPKLWLMLGEAASKCEHIAGVPLDPATAERLHQLYLAKGALATTAIEGNTLSEEEAREFLEGRLHLPPSREYLGQELTNVARACNELTLEIVSDGSHPLDVAKLKWMNAQVLQDLAVDEDVVPGEIRKHSVVVGRYRCAPAEDCEYLLERLCQLLNEFPSTLGSGPAGATVMTVVKAVFAHLYLVWIHPFGDGNGRTARLLELYILLTAGLPQPTGHLLSNHYNRTRSEYYRCLDAASHPRHSPEYTVGVVDFIRYAVQGFVDGLREQIAFIRERQWEVAWINYIHEKFQPLEGKTATRRRNLALWLSEAGPAGTRAISRMARSADAVTGMPHSLAVEFLGKTSRTLQRDVEELIDMGLLIRDKGGAIRPNKDAILAFLP